MIIWVNLIHIHQPPWQNPATLKSVVRQSYEKVFHTLEKHSSAKLTVNLTGSLAEQLKKYHPKLLERIKNLALRDQVELTATAKYHPILPFLPPEEIKHQIEINDAINRAVFGPAWHPEGMFLPEMAYTKELAETIAAMGYKWIVLDEIALAGKINNKINFNKKYFIKNTKLGVVFRDRKISKNYVPNAILKMSEEETNNKIIVTATDGELYGHWYQDWQNVFAKVLASKKIKTMRISGYLKTLEKKQGVEPKSSSWETTEEEIKNNIPFALWHDPANNIHDYLWQLAHLAIKTNREHNQGNKEMWPRRHLDRGLESSVFWWAAKRKPEAFAFITWNPDEIQKGVEELIRSIRSLTRAPSQTKLKAEKLYAEIIKEIWQKHWREDNEGK